jgi:hypothetical protein
LTSSFKIRSVCFILIPNHTTFLGVYCLSEFIGCFTSFTLAVNWVSPTFKSWLWYPSYWPQNSVFIFSCCTQMLKWKLRLNPEVFFKISSNLLAQNNFKIWKILSLVTASINTPLISLNRQNKCSLNTF